MKFLKNKLVSNIFSLFLLQGSNYILPLITLPYLIKVLGFEKYGLISFSTSFLQYFVILTDYGFQLSATKQISLNQENIDRKNLIFSSVMILKILIMIFSFIILFFMINSFNYFNENKIVYYISFLIVVGNVFFPVWFFQGIEKMKYITYFSVFSKILTTIAIFVFVKVENDYLLALFLQSIVTLLAGIFSFYFLFKKYSVRLMIPSLNDLIKELKMGWHIFLSTAAISLYTTSNIFILGLFTNNTTVGTFSAADKIIKAVQGLITPISQTIFPHINNLASESKTTALLFIKKILNKVGICFVIISILIYFGAECIVLLVFKGDLQVTNLIKIMAPVPTFVFYNTMFGTQVMLTFGLNKTFSNILIISGILNIIITFPLVYFFGSAGTALCVTFTEFFVTLIMFLVLRQKGYTLFSRERKYEL
ncbi:flippase [Paenibacillus hamazuiensis]|uniref:flippase n=1 Tax=Paenibacillus hamazuiensis TaxID=2936508 RepID=UPI0020106953|nr:flippase [Paenibacillus hamazuiensis]